tara:strand:- start:29054 stop:29872 length:819 start_codon:yes stop_codon:yes gene_type:complete
MQNFMHASIFNMRLKRKEAWKDYIDSLSPFAATTIQPNLKLDSIDKGELATEKNIDHLKSEIWNLSRKLDEFYFRTKGAVERISKTDRFDAFGVIEKPGVNPHVHLAWFLRSQVERERRQNGNLPVLLPCGFPTKEVFDPMVFEPYQKANRLCVLLQCFNRSHREMNEEDREFLDSFRKDRFNCAFPDPIPGNAICDWSARGWSVHTCSIEGDGWSRYIAKELGPEEASRQVFFLSDGFSSRQRLQPTRYHTRDWKTGAHMLDLDKPLKPRQ